MRLKEFHESRLPREKLAVQGASALTDCELLAILLQTGTKKQNVLNLSQSLLDNHSGISGIFKAPLKRLTTTPGIGPAKAMKLVVISEILKRINQQEKLITKISAPDDIYELFKYLAFEEQEHLCVVCVDTKSNVIGYKQLYVGTINEIAIHPREIFRYVVDQMAFAFFLVHNHPSGNPVASNADLVTTKKLIDASHIIAIELLDHIIVGSQGFTSIRMSNPQIFK